MVVAIFTVQGPIRMQFGEYDRPDGHQPIVWAARVRNQPALYRGFAGTRILRSTALLGDRVLAREKVVDH